MDIESGVVIGPCKPSNLISFPIRRRLGELYSADFPGIRLQVVIIE